MFYLHKCKLVANFEKYLPEYREIAASKPPRYVCGFATYTYLYQLVDMNAICKSCIIMNVNKQTSILYVLHV